MCLSLKHIFLLALAASPVLCPGQTCRMRVQIDGKGPHVEYREVYQYDYVWEKPSFPCLI